MTGALRLPAALVLIALGALMGYLTGEKINWRGECLNTLADDMNRLRVFMLEERLPLNQALARCLSPILRSDADSLEKRIRESGLPLKAEDIACLQEFFEALGRGTASEQRLLLPRAQERFAALRDSARERYRTLGRLYTSLGALGALALALMFI